MRLRKDNIRSTRSSDEDDDSSRYRPQARIYPATKAVSLISRSTNVRNLIRAARKTKSWAVSSSDSESAEPSGESDTGVVEPAALALSALKSDSESKVHMVKGTMTSPAHTSFPIKATGNVETPKLLNVGGLSLSTMRMQMSDRLPFLLRNVRRGFHQRCASLGIPVIPDSGSSKEISLVVKYTDDMGEEFETTLFTWSCVLCHILGNTIKTREMLACHLRWDHSDMLCKWTQSTDGQKQDVDTWELQIRSADSEVSSAAAQEHPSTPLTLNIKKELLETNVTTVGTRGRISILPPVYLSPPTPTAKRDPKVKSESSSPKSPYLRSSPPPPQRLSSKKGFTNDIPCTRVITPPPPEAPLGPAAQPPYLPAMSDYGGPTVFFSSRPNGPCLFDLLGTLPLEPFGMLDWDIIDREEELYESDPNIKDEYKVIQALWMRWILLERNNFIGDYFKNTMAFVDCFWKIIHRAAGWDALQYWLTVLLANRFLDAHQMAQVLRHYEGLTDMDNWYD